MPAKSPGKSTPEVFSPSNLAAGANGETLQYHGGEVQHKPELYLLFWGENFWNHTQPYFKGAEGFEDVSLYSVYKGFFNDLRNELNAPGEASWQGIMSQYYGATGGGYSNGKIVGELDNTEANFFSGITKANILKMINYWVERGLTQGPNTQVIVFTAPGTTFNEDPEGGCAYHGIDEQGYAYSFVPYAGDMNVYFKKHNENLTCDIREETNEAEIPQLMWSSTSIGSHEYAETVTDPGLNGHYSWFSSEGGEIGDLCSHWPVDSKELPAINGRPGWWYVTELWDDEGGNTCKLEDPPYSEPSPPTAATETATGIGYRQATVNGSLNPDGPEAHYWFEYGPTTGYGSKTSEAYAGYGTSTIGESATLTGLKPGTKYHYRIVAKTWVGVTNGSDKEFTTPIPPPVVTTEAATEVGEGHAKLNATVNPEEFNTTYQFEFWQAGKSSEVTKIPSTAESIGAGSSNIKVSQKPSLTSNTEYIYRVVATNAGGISSGKEVAVVTGPFLDKHTTPNPSGAEQSILYGMSCTSSSWCMGVGYTKNTAHEFAPLAEGWNGTEWQLMTPATPPGGKETSLKSVSCTSSTACTAVGSFVSSSNIEPLVERWNGTTWTIQSTPAAPTKDFYQLLGVACTSSTACIAVGDNVTNLAELESVTLAEKWNGVEWKVQTTPGKGQLNGISCTSGSACTAVGSTGFGGEPLAERWNGVEWTTQSAVKMSSAGLSSVSCTSATSCIAVGNSGGILGTPASNISQSWNGTTWSTVVVPNPWEAKNTFLRGVSCTSATSCVAVGSLDEATLADKWNGTEWRRMALPQAGATQSALYSVSCVAAYCATDGTYTSGGANLTLAGSFGEPGSQSETATGVTATGATLNASVDPNGRETTYHMEYGETTSYGNKVPVSDASISSSIAVEKVSQTIAELQPETTYHYRVVATNASGKTNGTDRTFTTATMPWVVDTTPNVSGAEQSNLYGVSCTSTSWCMGVGSTKNTAHEITPLSESWNGTAWKIVTPVTPTGAKETGLKSVSCASATACTAVGSYTSSSGALEPLAERWNGTTWAIQSTPTAPTKDSYQLLGVACTSATSCIAVGANVTGILESVTLAESWNGSEWKVVTTPNKGQLNAISCTSGSACTAVGSTGFGGEPLAERWNGTEWTLQAAAKISSTGLSGVSCASSTSCIAVGNSGGVFGSPTANISENWNGSTWSTVTVPTPTGAKETYLRGVSCSSATLCMAVGDVVGTAPAVLADKWNGTAWELKTLPVPTGVVQSFLNSISCAGAYCTTDGYYTNSAGTYLTLADSN
jgi:hypothetical protein